MRPEPGGLRRSKHPRLRRLVKRTFNADRERGRFSVRRCTATSCHAAPIRVARQYRRSVRRHSCAARPESVSRVRPRCWLRRRRRRRGHRRVRNYRQWADRPAVRRRRRAVGRRLVRSGCSFWCRRCRGVRRRRGRRRVRVGLRSGGRWHRSVARGERSDSNDADQRLASHDEMPFP
jgi:hypothetical protein